ncbi:MAG: CBS domain-containing protein [Chitinophagales bacterium]|nr:CBS domain-containing protein [Chitinophagales bacterium]HAE14261.1 signal transduction protein [Bacteroidota bacterium]MCB9018812.1 CBS domain-containing protein [Chitinophagales bacterium]MCB9020895.1 CBS domain-containing protein [Chitinophagales bacterium]MCB9031898.1 CBS domain-containing protein [Chitinophagales bacterium]
MGDQSSHIHTSGHNQMAFVNALIHDLEALELMIRDHALENDVQRIGAEQEMCLVNNEWRPDNNNLEVLAGLQDSCFTTELAKYNIELNCDPLDLQAGCFHRMLEGLQLKYIKAQKAASVLHSRVIMTGILPTISRHEVTLDYLTPLPRYHLLNKQLRRKRGKQFDLFMKGVDEIHIRHDNIMFEACNTSFQLHLQVAPEDFVQAYNWSQVIAAPVLAAATNSPLLFGKELWSEIRIALFQQSIETRKSVEELRDQRPRVTFGKDWIRNSITDIYKDDITHFDVLITFDDPPDSLQEYRNGHIPELRALRLHNGTVYRWNRPCYGVYRGKPHLRIENRYLPAGPSIRDEVANMAFWTGLMLAKPAAPVSETHSFRDIKSNFFKAARAGIETVLIWQGKELNTRTLILEELLPLAAKGLMSAGIPQEEISYHLNTIERRLKKQTGSQWQVRNFRTLRKQLSPSDAAIALTAAIYENQVQQLPVAEWKDVHLDKANKYLIRHFTTVNQLMSSDLITVFPDDTLLFVKKVMEWHSINHMLIENRRGELVGLITSGKIAELEAAGINPETNSVRTYMKRTIQTIRQDALIEDALTIMRTQKITSLPVVRDNRLVGIITRNDMTRWLSFSER